MWDFFAYVVTDTKMSFPDLFKISFHNSNLEAFVVGKSLC